MLGLMFRSLGNYPSDHYQIRFGRIPNTEISGSKITFASIVQENSTPVARNSSSFFREDHSEFWPFASPTCWSNQRNTCKAASHIPLVFIYESKRARQTHLIMPLERVTRLQDPVVLIREYHNTARDPAPRQTRISVLH